MIVIVMGVVGAGKTTVGSMLAAELGGNLRMPTIFIHLRMSKKFGTALRLRMPTVRPGSNCCAKPS